MRRRSFLAAPLLARPQFAQSSPPKFRQPPPYEQFRPLIGSPTAPPPAQRARPNTWFADVTGAVLESEQLSHGVPYYTARLDPATGIDIYGNHGIAVGDIDGDGWDEIFVCQPAGLPNKLFRFAGGQLKDITSSAGLDLLDDTVCALFLDLRNLGRQDLIVMRSGGPLLFLNDGRGRFTLRTDAFGFAQAPAGSFTGMAAADYDRDGKLDLYCCCYSFFQSEAQYRYPSPYHDAQNGPPNFLFRNRLQADGSGYFEDVTKAAGLDQNNNRFSFAPAWCDYDGSGWPSLYVANDFGRNNLYRNRAGKFEDVAAAAGVEDIGPGMSTCWFDENHDGLADLYIANMWTAAGQRLVSEPGFRNAALRDAYRGHTKGNSLYVNRGDGRFTEAVKGAEMGRWAWSSEAHDFDNDGEAEIAIACGMMTGEKSPDLMEFFWRQVVAASPARAGERSAQYENAWNALNQFIREGFSWNGHEANVFYRKQGDRYVDASAESGFDFAQDSRAFAVTDLDGDGCLDLLLKSRLAPQLRVLQNRRGGANQRIGFLLRGGPSNRDAIGARVRVGRQTKWVSAGSGYLSQHTKALYFGLGSRNAAGPIEIVWPSGHRQTVDELPAGSLYEIAEGGAAKALRTFAAAMPIAERAAQADNTQRLHDTWFVEPLPLPVRQRGAGLFTLASFPSADEAAAWSLFRRYLFEYRAELALPLHLLLDGQGRALKIYAKTPTPAQVRADLETSPQPLPYPGRWVGTPRRDFFKLGAALLSCGYPEQALPYLEEVLRRDRANVRTQILVGQVHREANRLPQARQRLNEALALDPAAAEAWNELGGVNQAERNDLKALECFESAIKLKPDLTYARLNAAQASSRLGRHADAAAHYRQAIVLEPANAEAHNGLGLAQAQQGQPAEAHFREAIRLQPALGSAWNNLAVWLLQQKRESEAVATLKEGLTKSPREELLYLNLARIHVARQDRAAARAVIEELLRQLPASATGRQALESLNR